MVDIDQDKFDRVLPENLSYILLIAGWDEKGEYDSAANTVVLLSDKSRFNMDGNSNVFLHGEEGKL